MRASRTVVLWSSLAFVIGFSTAFTLLGATATEIGKFLFLKKELIAEIAAVIIILLGLHMMGIFKIPFLYREKRIQVGRKPPGVGGAFLLGLAFAVGWTPCIGPFLGATLLLASQKKTVLDGMILLFTFSLGLGIPFLLAAMAIQAFFQAFRTMKKYFHVIEILGGLLLVTMGILLLTGHLTKIAHLAASLPAVETSFSGGNLTLFSAFLAGFLAFLSPCVLPLIPGYISYVSGISLQEL